MIATQYKFAHYSKAPDGGPDLLKWASAIGQFQEEIRRGSKLEKAVLLDQQFTSNFLTDHGENDMLDVFFRNGSAPTFYFGLWNATPTETSDMTLAGEVTGTGYARISVARNSTDWPTLALDSGDYRTVSVTKTFTAGGAWSAATRLLLVSTASGTSGRLYAAVALSTTRTLADGDSLNVSMAVKQS